MRELTLQELDLVAGGATASNTLDTTIKGGGAGYAATRVAVSTLRGAAQGARAGIWGAAAGALVGLGAGLYDMYQDGSDYGDGTSY